MTKLLISIIALLFMEGCNSNKPQWATVIVKHSSLKKDTCHVQYYRMPYLEWEFSYYNLMDGQTGSVIAIDVISFSIKNDSIK